MNDEIREIVWRLSRYVQSCQLAGLKDEKVSSLFKQVFALRLATLSADAEEFEHQIIEQCYTAVSAEVVIAADGTFRKGEKELRRALSVLSFEEMMKFIDAILNCPISEEQRMTIINLARDNVYAKMN